ncbi:uncharacterized protein BCR38DRAFT_246136 [Pseudomassariella vexata]|uniref:Uncharacterized protein n=1 Tax=Pseudomassariella vexata TaxID=1141098 RepID=A0A1Y2DVM3_9PEZI|nr:uncharacterized protein BCR38DRAFT_246136 [Pseudomassariella vexata]ORY62695.1 hypothetical protein BCR38DRAFT_246136 [Pseudomassariella vexata]
MLSLRMGSVLLQHISTPPASRHAANRFYTFLNKKIPVTCSRKSTTRFVGSQALNLTNPTSQVQMPNTRDDTRSEPREPTGLIAQTGIELLTLGTPNGYKASSMCFQDLQPSSGCSWEQSHLPESFACSYALGTRLETPSSSLGTRK